MLKFVAYENKVSGWNYQLEGSDRAVILNDIIYMLHGNEWTATSCFSENEVIEIAFALDFKFNAHGVNIDVGQQVNQQLARNNKNHADGKFLEGSVSLDDGQSRFEKHNIDNNRIINIFRNVGNVNNQQ